MALKVCRASPGSWCDDSAPFHTIDLGDGEVPSNAPGVLLWNLSCGESLKPTCGQANFFGSTGYKVRAIQSDHFTRGPAWAVWTFVHSDHHAYVRAVDINVTNIRGAVYAHSVQAWYSDKSDFPGTSTLTAANVSSAFDSKTGLVSTTTGYRIYKLTFRIETQDRDVQEIFGEYFDIVSASRSGSWVSGRLQPRANMFANISDWSFSLFRPGACLDNLQCRSPNFSQINGASVNVCLHVLVIAECI